MITKGEIEDKLTKEAIKFCRNILGIGPREAKTYILADMIIFRLKGQLLPIEQQLLRSENGIELVKNMRQHLHDVSVVEMTKIIKTITGQKVISSHSDVSTKTGEIFEVFILDRDYQSELEIQK